MLYLSRNIQAALWLHDSVVTYSTCEEGEEFYKLLPANKADCLRQLWQSCSDLHRIETVYDIVENPHMLRLSKT